VADPTARARALQQITDADGIAVLRLSTTPGHLIRRAQQVHTSIWAESLGGQLTGPQYSVLVALAQEPEIDQTRLAELASLDKNTTADIVRRLAGQGWIERTVDDGDRRRRLLRLSAPATIAMRHITPAARLAQEDLLAFVDADRHEGLVEVLARIAFQWGAPSSVSRDTPVPVLLMDRTPGYLIRRIQQVQGVLWSRQVGSELTGPQYAVLVALAAQPGADQVTVGSLASLDKSSTADIVARLVRDGWVHRSINGGQGRRNQLRLTETARSRLGAVTAKAATVQEELLAPLDRRQASAFVRDLSLVAYRGHPPVA
jgi:DNA-binding MarR family transcriptional regulator